MGRGSWTGKHVVGYRDEERVNPESGTETYAALRLEIENWRWAGVPFYLRAGKRLKKRATEISIQFKQPPLLIFNRMAAKAPCQEIQPNLLTIRIQPDEGIALRFGAKVPTTPNMDVCPVNMDFDYAAAFGKSSANGYERLLLDAMLGDQTLFSHRDGVEINWALYTPILEAWAAKNRRYSQITLPEPGARNVPTICWSAGGISGGTIWGEKFENREQRLALAFLRCGPHSQAARHRAGRTPDL